MGPVKFSSDRLNISCSCRLTCPQFGKYDVAYVKHLLNPGNDYISKKYHLRNVIGDKGDKHQTDDGGLSNSLIWHRWFYRMLVKAPLHTSLTMEYLPENVLCLVTLMQLSISFVTTSSLPRGHDFKASKLPLLGQASCSISPPPGQRSIEFYLKMNLRCFVFPIESSVFLGSMSG